MTPPVRFTIEGLDGVVETMRLMGPRLRNKGLKTAVRKGAMVIRRAARVNARKVDDPDTPSMIWRAISLQYSRRGSQRMKGVLYRVGVRGGAKEPPGGKTPITTFHWRFLEFGTSRMRAQPIMRPALANNVRRATDEVVKALGPELTRLARDGVARSRRGRR